MARETGHATQGTRHRARDTGTRHRARDTGSQGNYALPAVFADARECEQVYLDASKTCNGRAYHYWEVKQRSVVIDGKPLFQQKAVVKLRERLLFRLPENVTHTPLLVPRLAATRISQNDDDIFVCPSTRETLRKAVPHAALAALRAIVCFRRNALATKQLHLCC